MLLGLRSLRARLALQSVRPHLISKAMKSDVSKGGLVKSLAELSKFRLSSLVVFTSGAGFLAAGSPVDVCTMAFTCIGTALCAASAGTFNQIFEINADAQMRRTAQRPLPAGKVSPTVANLWGVATGAAGTGLLLASSSPTVAMLGLGNIALYAGAYTYSKRVTELNTWIGSVVGAIPPVMGWCAAGGSLMAAEPWALASILFLWQFPHFFALSWLYREDYARGGFQMVGVNDPHGLRSADYILEYSYYLAALPVLSSVTGLTSYMFAVEGTAANIYLLMLAHRFKRDRSNANARRIFLCSLWYLPVLLVGFVFHGRAWQTDKINNAEKEDKITEAVAHAKETLKGVCVHEMIAANDTHQAPHLCVKVTSDKAVDTAISTVTEVVSSERRTLNPAVAMASMGSMEAVQTAHASSDDKSNH